LAGQAYQAELTWSCRFKDFIQGMQEHTIRWKDRWKSFNPDLSLWKSILYSDLQDLAGMLFHMHDYINPEWGFRQDLNTKHVHEALMRLLLAEIVQIEDGKADILLQFACQNLPGKPKSEKASASFQSSTSQSTSLTQTKSPPPSNEPLLHLEHQESGPSSGRKRSRSQL
jgi:hypothetical protein